MAIRFLLVTLVAGMSLELPSQDDVSSWMRSGRIWVAARMDDWSVTNARKVEQAKDRAFKQIVDDMSRSFTRDLARLEAKNKPQVLLAKTFEPISVPDVFAQDLVSKLIEQSTSPDDRVQVADVLWLTTVDELNLTADGLRPLAADIALVEAARISAPKPAPVPAPPAAAAPAPPAPVHVAVRIPVKVSTPGIALAAAAAAQIPAAPVAAPAPAPAAPVIAAVMAETVHQAPVVTVTESDPARTERLASAIKLTRQAVGAWASLLNSGAMVRR